MDRLLTDILTDYLLSRPGTSAEHGRQGKYSVLAFERFLSRPPTVADLTDRTLLMFLAAYGSCNSHATANAKRAYLLALWRFAAYDLHLCQPPGRIRRLPENREAPEAWTVDQITSILSACNRCRGSISGLPAGPWMRSLILALYDCGGRVGAVRRVRPADVDLDARWIILRSSTDKSHVGKLRELSEQTATAIRVIYSPLRPLVWPWPYSREALDRRLRRVLEWAKVPHGRSRGGLWHKFRRTSGTLVEAAGGDGAKHLGNTRAVFERHYRDPRIAGKSQLDLLPRPNF